MIEFTDNVGVAWHPRLTIPAMQAACRALDLTLKQLTQIVMAVTAARTGGTKIDLSKILDEVGGLAVADLLELPYFAVQKEAAERKLSREEFLERLGPQEFGAALTACVNALVRDFPQAGDSGLAQTVEQSGADPTGPTPT